LAPEDRSGSAMYDQHIFLTRAARNWLRESFVKNDTRDDQQPFLHSCFYANYRLWEDETVRNNPQACPIDYFYKTNYWP
jgi:hypothetical protein